MKLFNIIKVYGWKYFFNILFNSVSTKINSKVDWHFNESRIVIEKLFPCFKSKNGNILKFEIENYNYYLRLNSSDFAIYNQVYIQQEYRILIDFFSKFGLDAHIMIDCGGNIGLASLLFKTKFQHLNIFLFEPNSTNLNIAKMNLQNFDSIVFYQKAVYTKSTTLYEDYSFRMGTSSSFRYVEEVNSNPTVETENIIEFVKKIDIIDFLKVDIEGGEKPILEDVSENWLQNVKVIAVEIHDEIVNRFLIQNNLHQWGFILTKCGEYTIGFNKNHWDEHKIQQFILNY